MSLLEQPFQSFFSHLKKSNKKVKYGRRAGSSGIKFRDFVDNIFLFFFIFFIFYLFLFYLQAVSLLHPFFFLFTFLNSNRKYYWPPDRNQKIFIRWLYHYIYSPLGRSLVDQVTNFRALKSVRVIYYVVNPVSFT